MSSTVTSVRRRVARLYFWLTLFVFVAYLALGFVFGPGFFLADFKDRFHALADEILVVTATVLGPPATPVVTATPVCVAGAPRVNLNWADDAATTTWDVERDTLPLTTGLVVSQYTDASVANATSYSYVVIAHGPMFPGIATSAPVSVTTLDCPTLLPPPTVLIETVGGTNVATNRTKIEIEKRRPRITGTTNVSNALIDILVTNPTIQARIAANANGYFSWIPPIRLRSGAHFLSVTATDPNDNSRTVTDSFIFRTEYPEEKEDRKETVLVPTTPPLPPLDFSVRVENPDSILFQGDELAVLAESLKGAFPSGASFQVTLVNERDEEVVHFAGRAVENAGQTLMRFDHKLPLSLAPGVYAVRVDGATGLGTVSREAVVVVRAWPLIDLGGGRELTYVELVRFVGTIFYSLFFLLLLYLLLFFREYLLSLERLRDVSEHHLAHFGFIPKRKEVRRP